MGTAQEKFNNATQEALCAMLSAVGAGAANYAAWGLLTPGPFDEWGALGLAGVAGLAYGYGCQWDSDNDTGTPVDWTPGCQKYSAGGTLRAQNKTFPQTDLVLASNCAEILSISDAQAGAQSTCTYLDTSGIQQQTAVAWASSDSNWYIELPQGASCDLPIAPTPDQPPAPYVYTDPDDGCQLIVNFQGFAVDGGGNPGPVWKIEQGGQLRAGGGIIGGCNFQPIVYYQPPSGPGGPGGPGGPYAPWNPGPDGPGGEPWWMDVARSVLGGVVGAAVKAILDEVLQGSVGSKVYRITSVCETDSQGEPISQSVEVDIPTLPWDEAIIYRLDALEHIMQGLKDFKQPICRPSKGQGDLVTVHFESDEPSIAGERPLRKTLNYRDQMASDLGAHAAHWENFVWEAGDTIVYHEGAAWGKLTVWANSADEGKRVIRHAGTISGVNPDAEGEWAVTHTSSPRYGRTGTMRLAKRKSNQGMVLRISKRGGPDGLPVVPVDPFP